MAKRSRPRETHRAAVSLGGASLLISLASIDVDGGSHITDPLRWFQRVDELDGPLPQCRRGASIVLDRFAFQLHLGDSGGFYEGTHVGDEFVELAVRDGVAVRVLTSGDARRISAADLDAAVRAGDVVGATVPAYEVAVL